MKSNEKGFTLIELLAVIVILAIIALIATPIVLNLINKARKGAAQNSAYGIRQAAKLYYQKDLIDNIEGFQDIEFNCTVSGCVSADKKLDFEGTNPSSGKVKIDSKGNIIGEDIVINGYICGTKTIIDGVEHYIFENSGSIVCDKASNSSNNEPNVSPTASPSPAQGQEPVSPSASIVGSSCTGCKYAFYDSNVEVYVLGSEDYNNGYKTRTGSQIVFSGTTTDDYRNLIHSDGTQIGTFLQLLLDDDNHVLRADVCAIQNYGTASESVVCLKGVEPLENNVYETYTDNKYILATVFGEDGCLDSWYRVDCPQDITNDSVVFSGILYEDGDIFMTNVDGTGCSVDWNGLIGCYDD